jgi:hypothetical protein
MYMRQSSPPDAASGLNDRAVLPSPAAAAEYRHGVEDLPLPSVAAPEIWIRSCTTGGFRNAEPNKECEGTRNPPCRSAVWRVKTLRKWCSRRLRFGCDGEAAVGDLRRTCSDGKCTNHSPYTQRLNGKLALRSRRRRIKVAQRCCKFGTADDFMPGHQAIQRSCRVKESIL